MAKYTQYRRESLCDVLLHIGVNMSDKQPIVIFMDPPRRFGNKWLKRLGRLVRDIRAENDIEDAIKKLSEESSITVAMHFNAEHKYGSTKTEHDQKPIKPKDVVDAAPKLGSMAMTTVWKKTKVFFNRRESVQLFREWYGK